MGIFDFIKANTEKKRAEAQGARNHAVNLSLYDLITTVFRGGQSLTKMGAYSQE